MPATDQPVTYEPVVPNPKLKLLDQIREVMRLKHYSLRTERSYCDWVRRFVQFHGMRSREEMLPGEPKMEAFLSDLAVAARRQRHEEPAGLPLRGALARREANRITAGQNQKGGHP